MPALEDKYRSVLEKWNLKNLMLWFCLMLHISHVKVGLHFVNQARNSFFFPITTRYILFYIVIGCFSVRCFCLAFCPSLCHFFKNENAKAAFLKLEFCTKGSKRLWNSRTTRYLDQTLYMLTIFDVLTSFWPFESANLI